MYWWRESGLGLWVLGAGTVLFGLSGCDKAADDKSGSQNSAASGSAQSAASAPVAQPKNDAPPPPAPDDLKVAALQKALKCNAESKNLSCRVLNTFASSCTPWNAVSPSGDARYLGRAEIVEGSKVSEQIVILRSKRVPSVDVGPGQLPVKIALTDLPKEEGAAFDQAERAIRAFDRGDVPQRASPTMEYIKKRADWPEEHAAKTVSGQVLANIGGGVFICQGPKQKLLVVKLPSSTSVSGDGLYAEMYATSW